MPAKDVPHAKARAAGLQGAPPTSICLDVARIGILSDALGRLWGRLPGFAQISASRSFTIFLQLAP
jgi:hypothetical protein